MDTTIRKPIKRALISVYHKDGLENLARALGEHQVEIVSTGSTAKVIKSYGIDVTDVSSVTGFQECLDGRVKTLHPNVHAGILADLQNDDHRQQLDALDVKPFDLVVVNLYPFAETVANGAGFNEIIEKIDIGGPSMVRGAAKNFENVAVVTNTDDYQFIIDGILSGGTTQADRFYLATKAFAHTAAYDVGIESWFNSQTNDVTSGFMNFEGAVYSKVSDLRYGENPHQKAAVYADVSGHSTVPAYGSIVGAKVLSSGKEMSFNNYIDAESAIRAVYDISDGGAPACAIIKHSNPCGLAQGVDILNAYQKAFACDPVSAYGGVVAANQVVTLEMAKALKPVFTEVIIAPNYQQDALELLLTKKNLRILQLTPQDDAPHRKLPNGAKPSLIEARKITGGLLVQDRDVYQADGDDSAAWSLVSGNAATEQVLDDLRFAWCAVRSVKSNAILLAKNGATVGIGMGQVNRLDSCDLAILRANTLGQATQGSQVDSAGGAQNVAATSAPERTRGSVAASDAFFPFADGLQKLIDAGVSAVVQPGGSIRDDEVIQTAKDAGITMYLTGSRHFYH